MRNYDEIDYVVHEYYRQTGKIVGESLDSLIRAVRYIQRHQRSGKGPKTSRSGGKRRCSEYT